MVPLRGKKIGSTYSYFHNSFHFIEIHKHNFHFAAFFLFFHFHHSWILFLQYHLPWSSLQPTPSAATPAAFLSSPAIFLRDSSLHRGSEPIGERKYRATSSAAEEQMTVETRKRLRKRFTWMEKFPVAPTSS